jgi:Ca2+-transporting ATPase
VARSVGIFQEGDLALTGDELEDVPDEQFEEMVEKVKVYARVSPMDKLKIISTWKKRGQIVAMTGDGVNDAPALKNADIGIAMGITGTEVTKEASDMILADDNFATIIGAVEKGRWIYDNIKKYLTYLLRANLIEVVLLGGVVLLKGGAYMPLFPAAILFINVITDGLPAIALGIAPPDPDIMARPPRDPDEKVFSPDVLLLMVMSLFTVVPFFYWVFLREGQDLVQARTELFFLFVFVELVMALNFRSLRYSIIKVPPHGLLVGSVVLSAMVTIVVVQLPFVREAFGITVPNLAGITLVIAITLWVTVSTEMAKVYLVKRKGPASNGKEQFSV